MNKIVQIVAAVIHRLSTSIHILLTGKMNIFRVNYPPTLTWQRLHKKDFCGKI
jgi:hypothetical protein